jgi:hypothetical protein
VSVIFVPYSVGVGPSGAMFGLIGVLFVEAFQLWQIERRPWLNFLKVAGGNFYFIFISFS